jgi:ferric iron reductase protein FhuF
MKPEFDVSVLHNLFRISFTPQSASDLQFAAVGLLQKEEGKAFLRQVGTHIGSPSYVVTASLFFKRFLPLISGGLYAMSVHSAGLNLSLHNVTLYAEENWKLPGFYLRDAAWFTPGAEGREQWREKVVQRLFRDTVKPLISALTSYTGIHTNVLWSHAAYIVHYYYGEWLKQTESDELRARIADDFRFLREAEPKTLGLREKNPLAAAFTVVPHPADADRLIQIRRQCCFQHRLPEGRCCYTCPLLNEEKRMEQILAAGH